MARLKVLFVTSWYPTKEQPVGGIFVREHAKAVQLYDDVVVLHLAGPRPGLRRTWELEMEPDSALIEGIPTYRLWYRRLPVPKTSFLIRVWGTFAAIRKLKENGFNPDIIHANVYDSAAAVLPAVRLYHIPFVVTEHWSGFPRRLLGRLDAWAARIAFGSAGIVIPVSHILKRSIEDYGIRARFHVVPNVVDTDLFHPGERPRSSGDVKKLLFVGLLDHAHIKGVPYLLQSLSALKRKRSDWHLDIVGDGPARKEYERMVEDLGLKDNVTFLGLKPKWAVAELMRSATLFVLPSVTETFGVVAAEALASGTPVLATRCGGPEEFVTTEVGELVPPRDPVALAQGINRILESIERFDSQKISEYAVRQFGRSVVGLKLHQLYLGLLEKPETDDSGLWSEGTA